MLYLSIKFFTIISVYLLTLHAIEGVPYAKPSERCATWLNAVELTKPSRITVGGYPLPLTSFPTRDHCYCATGCIAYPGCDVFYFTTENGVVVCNLANSTKVEPNTIPAQGAQNSSPAPEVYVYRVNEHVRYLVQNTVFDPFIDCVHSGRKMKISALFLHANLAKSTCHNTRVYYHGQRVNYVDVNLVECLAMTGNRNSSFVNLVQVSYEQSRGSHHLKCEHFTCERLQGDYLTYYDTMDYVTRWVIFELYENMAVGVDSFDAVQLDRHASIRTCVVRCVHMRNCIGVSWIYKNSRCYAIFQDPFKSGHIQEFAGADTIILTPEVGRIPAYQCFRDPVTQANEYKFCIAFHGVEQCFCQPGYEIKGFIEGPDHEIECSPIRSDIRWNRVMYYGLVVMVATCVVVNVVLVALVERERRRKNNKWGVFGRALRRVDNFLK